MKQAGDFESEPGGSRARAEPAAAPLRWGVTLGALLVALLSGAWLYGMASTYRAGSGGAAMYAQGRTAEAYPFLREAFEGTRMQVRPCLEIGDLAVWAIDDGLFQSYYRIEDARALARLAFLAYVEALDRQPTSSRAWAGLAELFKKIRVLNLKEGIVDLDALERETEPGYEREDRLVIAAYRRALLLEPNNYFYHAWLGDFYDERGFRGEAMGSYARAIEIMPDLSWHYYLPRTGLEPDLFEAARSGLEKALDEEGSYPRDRILQNLGDLAERHGDRPAAAEYYRRAAGAAADPSPYLLMLGNLHFIEKRYDQAVEALEGALERESLLPEKQGLAHTLLGRCARFRGELEASARHLQRARWLNPKAAYVAVDLGRTFEELGEQGLAEIEYRNAIQIDPSRSSGYTALIDMYRRTHQIHKAIPLAEKLVEMFPGQRVFQDQLRRLEEEGGRPGSG